MYIKLFQLNMKRDEHRVCFCSLDTMMREVGVIPSECYDLVFGGDVDCADLEALYAMFNRDDRPGAKEFRSMSVSDVVAVRDPESGEERYWYCDSIGFEKVNFEPDLAVKRDMAAPELIAVVFVEPGRAARLVEVYPSFKGVGGLYELLNTDLIEQIAPFNDTVCILLDEEGKLKGRECNRALCTEDGEPYDVIAGPFVVCGFDGFEYASLTEEQQRRYLELYRYPETFVRDGGVLNVIRENL